MSLETAAWDVSFFGMTLAERVLSVLESMHVVIHTWRVVRIAVSVLMVMLLFCS